MERYLQFGVLLKEETDKAYLFVFDEDEEERWVPKSQCVWEPETEDLTGGTVEVPEWWANKEGLPT